MTDNSPFINIVPAVYWDFFTSAGDYYDKFIFATFMRYLRQLSLFLSISASSFYVMLTSFHQEMLPTTLALKIAADRGGVPFPAILEAFIMEIVIEIMKEAGLRLPKPIGQTVSIVGTLVVGQAAVSAGLVGPMLVIAIGIEAISSFSLPSYNMSNAYRVIRFPILLTTSVFGLLGYVACIILLMMHLMSMRSFGTPYLSPVIPLDQEGIKDVLTRSPWWIKTKRPRYVKPKDSIKQASDLRPKPPK